MLTGYYPSTTGVYSTSGAQNALPLEFALLPGLLKDRAGYRTAAVGKRHLGFMSEADLPERRGFDSFFGFNTARDYDAEAIVAVKANTYTVVSEK